MLESALLYIIAFVWIMFAVVQDLRSREISNWLNFSLISFALAYRAFYSSASGNWSFFLWGLGGFALFWVLAYVLYYARAFAGGDAKLLMGLGAVLPFASYSSYALLSFVFILLLFGLGAVYSLIYTAFLAMQNKKDFVRAFNKEISVLRSGKVALLLIGGIIVFAVIAFVITNSIVYSILAIAFVLFSIILLFYTKAIEKACFVKLVKPQLLTEGDWLVRDVLVGGKTIKASVHGLNKKDILLLKKYNKNIFVKYGVPFAPAFLFALIGFLIVIYRFTDFLNYFGL